MIDEMRREEAACVFVTQCLESHIQRNSKTTKWEKWSMREWSVECKLVSVSVGMLLVYDVHAYEGREQSMKIEISMKQDRERDTVYLVSVCTRQQVQLMSPFRVSRFTLMASKSRLWQLSSCFHLCSSTTSHALLPLQMADTLSVILQIDEAICHLFELGRQRSALNVLYKHMYTYSHSYVSSENKLRASPQGCITQLEGYTQNRVK